ncbi:sulfatase-like hydrolase/transferase [candidate division KSB1 bacterium]|nr:sulfatase-like hydrolase/transferase [candidate division KSB1 bacterium]
MQRRTFLKTLMAGWGTGMSGVMSGMFACSGPARNPNFVFILVDDLGWPDPGCYGNTFHETPNIDSLASQGMRFTDAYAACPVCSPTRASIYSGQYPARLGLTDFIPGHWRPYEKLRVPVNEQQYMPLEIMTLAESLKTKGYATAAFGKWHCGRGPEYSGDKQGFDDYIEFWGGHFGPRNSASLELDENDYYAEVITGLGEQFLQENTEKPFCLFLNHYAVHIPLQAREALIRKYEQKAKPETGVNNPVYAAMVEHVDHSVGRIMNKLDELQLTRDTVLVFFSDNGGLRQRYDEQGPVVSTNAPLRDEKGTLYEGGIRVPLIIRYPRLVEAGSECAVPVTSVDFYPTFLELAECEPPQDQELDGQSLVPLLDQSGEPERQAIFWHYPHYHHSVPAGAVRRGDWKLIEFYDDNHIELYDIHKDMGENQNLASSEPAKAKELQQLLAEWRISVNASMPVPNPDYDPERADEWGRHPDRN